MSSWLENLPIDCLVVIACHLDRASCLRLACASKPLRSAALDDIVWKVHIERDYKCAVSMLAPSDRKHFYARYWIAQWQSKYRDCRALPYWLPIAWYHLLPNKPSWLQPGCTASWSRDMPK